MKIRVLGIGNVLMSDDGFGPFVVRLLDATYESTPDVEFIDVGTPGLDLTPYLLGVDAVIFVDALSSKGNAGEIRVYDREDILRHPPQPRTGGHDPAMKEALLTVAAAGRGPSQVTLIGVIPEWITTGVVLSLQVQAAVGRAAATVIRALKSLGVSVALRVEPQVPDVWWAKSPDGVSVPARRPRG
jgi:hydrogenase maturation protease